MTPVASTSTSPPLTDRRGLNVELDVVELWVHDLDQTQQLFTTRFDFHPAQAPDPPGAGERRAAVVCGGVRVVLRQGRSPQSAIARHVAEHGDTVGDVSLVCTDPRAIAARASAHGLQVSGTKDIPRIDLFGDGTVCHSVRGAPIGLGRPAPSDRPQMRGIDHVAYCLPWETAERAARVYEDVFGLERVDVGELTEVGGAATGMRSIVLRSQRGFTVVLTEPVSQASTGQTQRFVDAHAGPGVQHLALAYDDLFTAVDSLRRRGVTFLPIPDVYYAQARQRLPELPVPWETLRRLQILVDADDQGLLYQLFTRPFTDRGTFFVELIQRAGATGFGVNNVRALFAAVEASVSGTGAEEGS